MSKKKVELESADIKIEDNKVEKKEILAPEVLKANEVFVEGYGVLKIKPTKLKYFVYETKDVAPLYNNIQLIHKMGYNNLLGFADGKDIIKNALKAIFDTDEIDFFDYLTSRNLLDICRKADEINEVKEEDFLLETIENQKGKSEEEAKSKKPKKE